MSAEGDDDLNNPGELAIHEHDKRFADDEPELDDPHADIADEQVRRMKARLESEIDKAAATHIGPDAPGYDFLVKSRNKQLIATRQLHNVAIGEVPDDFLAPDQTEPSFTRPKPSTGFAVATNRRKRPAAPAPAHPDPVTKPAANLAPAPWLWRQE